MADDFITKKAQKYLDPLFLNEHEGYSVSEEEIYVAGYNQCHSEFNARLEVLIPAICDGRCRCGTWKPNECDHNWEDAGGGDKFEEVCTKCGARRASSWN